MRLTPKAAWIFALAVALLAPAAGHSEPAREAVVHKDPACGCCAEYARYLERNGFAVTVIDTADMAVVKSINGVPDALAGCHTVLIDRYVVEGHVPVSVLDELLSQRPEITGVSLPGMPPGSPGMGGVKSAPFTIYEISEGPPKIFAVE